MAGVPPPTPTPEEAADAEAFKAEGQGARFYENAFPQVDECVFVLVRSIQEMGAYVTLPEYGNIEGMILLSELSRRRIRSVNKLIRVGKTEIAMVMRVDEQKGYIDLSKRRVTPEEAIKCEERFQKSKAVHSIMRHVAQVTGKTLLEVNETVTWPLARNPTFRSAYDALRVSLSDPDLVFGTLKDVDPNVIRVIQSDVKKRLMPQAIKIRADIEVQCFAYQGIEAVRATLRRGLAFSTKETPIAIKLIAPPLYVMLTTSMDKSAGIALLEASIAAMEEEIKKHDGKLAVKHAPRATSTQEENQLASLLEQMEQEQREIDGDDEDDDDMGMGGDGSSQGGAAGGGGRDKSSSGRGTSSASKTGGGMDPSAASAGGGGAGASSGGKGDDDGSE